MKITPRSLFFRVAIGILALTLSTGAFAETPREQLTHAFRLISGANSDYAGHRRRAMTEIEAAAKELGIEVRGEVSQNERQWKSDQQMSEARRLLVDARDHMEKQDRDRVAGHVETAIKEVEDALRMSEPAKDEIAHAYRLVLAANGNYAGHRRRAMTELQTAASVLGVELKGELGEHERQWKSDEQMTEARRLIADARDRLEKQDLEKITVHLEGALTAIDESLKVK